MKSLSRLTTCWFLASLSVVACKTSSKDSPNPEINPTIETLFPANSQEGGTASSSAWLGTCIGATEADMSLLLQRDLSWSMTSIRNSDNFSSESGKYLLQGNSITFTDDLRLSNSMSCDVLKSSTAATSLRCSLLTSNKIAFFQNCKQVTFVSAAPAPSEPPKTGGQGIPIIPETGGIGGGVVVEVGPKPDDNVCKNQTKGNLSEVWQGTCGASREVTVNLSSDGTYTSAVFAFSDSGPYCVDAANNLTLIPRASIDPIKCTRSSNGDLICTGFFSCNGAATLKKL